MALLGPSGSGKTTLLRMIAGFERPDAGARADRRAHVAGDGDVGRAGAAADRHGLPAGRAVPAPRRRRPTSASAPRAASASARRSSSSGSPTAPKAYPHELSGGERQRVALARALAADPEVILLDEPFAALDAGLRETLREEVAAILRAAGASALLVTHDQAEALSLADEVAVLRDGRVVQTGSPEEVYDRPSSRWVAEFLGEADVLPGTAEGGTVRCELGRFSAGRELSGEVQVVIRPESVAIGHGAGPRATPPRPSCSSAPSTGTTSSCTSSCAPACACAAAGSGSRPGIRATACACGSTGR